MNTSDKSPDTRRAATRPREVPKSAGRVPRAGDEIEEEEMAEAQADGRVHAQSQTPAISPGRRR
jgi:hypothetical protein